eukprot:m.357967 g.357967  ORF g.357967 m.357967 type:complete len:204 (+) comp18000_c0_seq1:1104-1715(+)
MPVANCVCEANTLAQGRLIHSPVTTDRALVRFASAHFFQGVVDWTGCNAITITMAESDTKAKQVELGMCAARECRNKCTKRCARCRVVFYCSRDCQTKHWGKHKTECKDFAALGDDIDMSDPSMTMRAHHREFRRIVQQYGLDKGDKVDLLADFLTDSQQNQALSPAQLAEKFDIPPQEASTLLAWVDVGLRFKERNLDQPSS